MRKIRIDDAGLEIPVLRDGSIMKFRTPVLLNLPDDNAVKFLFTGIGLIKPQRVFAVKDGFPDVRLTKENCFLTEDELWPEVKVATAKMAEPCGVLPPTPEKEVNVFDGDYVEPKTDAVKEEVVEKPAEEIEEVETAAEEDVEEGKEEVVEEVKEDKPAQNSGYQAPKYNNNNKYNFNRNNYKK